VPATDIARLHPVIFRKGPHDRPMLAVGTDGKDDGFGAEMHGGVYQFLPGTGRGTARRSRVVEGGLREGFIWG